MTVPRLHQDWMDDPAVRRVVAALQAAGGADAARFVGGCVRDALLGRAVADIDIATPLTPEASTAALEAAGVRVVPTGVEHGTVTAIADHRPFEVTTLRRDVETDGRRAVVAFTRDWAEDAARRDFRLNALYLDAVGRLFDPIGGGLDDALAGRIVFVGDAETRIREDYLRILRFFRFFAWYGRGEPDPVGLAACARLAEGVAGLSGERVAKELLKLIAAPSPMRSVQMMIETGVAARLLPDGLRPDVLARMVSLAPDAELRLAALLPADAASLAEAASRLRLSNAQKDRLKAAVGAIPRGELGDAEALRLVYRWGAQTFSDRVLLAAATGVLEADRALALAARAKDWSRPRFPVDGRDGQGLGVAAGPRLGALLRELEAWWVERDFLPDRSALLAELKARADG